MRYVIIGGGPAGLNAAEAIRKHDASSEIIIFSSEKELPYERFLLPELLGNTRSEDSLLLRQPDFFDENRIQFQTGEIVKIRPKKSTVTTDQGKYNFDRLLIATGGIPALPRRSLLKVKGVFALRTLADARSIDAYLRDENVEEAAVVGGGIVGLKAAYLLSRRGIDVSIVEQESRLLPRVLDSDSMAPVAKLCWKNKFRILIDERFREFHTSGKDKKVSDLVTYSGRSIGCQAAIMCPGAKPQLELARSAGVDFRDGIIVDDFMRTSVENIFAAGDVIETRNVTTGENEVMPLWANAVEQGWIAGANMTGAAISYPGAIWQNSLKLFGLAVVTLGQSHLSDSMPEAEALVSPGHKDGDGLRLVFSRKKLIGATLLGDVGHAGYYKKIIMDRIPVWDHRDLLLKGDIDALRQKLDLGAFA